MGKKGQGPKRTRREFIVHAALGFGAYLAIAEAGCKRDEPQGTAPAKGKKKRAEAPPAAPPEARPGKGLLSLTATEYATVSAACERILPRDEDPGATDLGCADYLDRALSLPDVKELWGRPIFGGLPILDRQAHNRHAHSFADCTAEQQDALLTAWQKSSHSGESAFFEVLHTLTLEGAFGDPTYGGNRRGAGFLLVGFVPPPPMPGQHLLDLMGR